MEESKKVPKKYVRRITSTQRNGTNKLRYTIPYHLQPNDTINICAVYTYTRKKKYEEGQKGKEQKERKQKKNETKTNMWSGRRPSPEGTRLLFVGTLSPITCSVDGPTEGRHQKKLDRRQGR